MQKNNSDNSKMATETKRFIKYTCKPISSKLQEHFGFKLLADHNIKSADQVFCILSDKSFAYKSRTYHLKKTLAIVFKTLACKVSFI